MISASFEVNLLIAMEVHPLLQFGVCILVDLKFRDLPLVYDVIMHVIVALCKLFHLKPPQGLRYASMMFVLF